MTIQHSLYIFLHAKVLRSYAPCLICYKTYSSLTLYPIISTMQFSAFHCLNNFEFLGNIEFTLKSIQDFDILYILSFCKYRLVKMILRKSKAEYSDKSNSFISQVFFFEFQAHHPNQPIVI